jgi:diphosphomevalonate decarboxylase
MLRVATCAASPSLALIKYWGKQPVGVNIPATSSLAVTLSGLETVSSCEVTEDGSDRVEIDGTAQPAERFAPFFESLRTFLCRTLERSQTLSRTKDPSSLRFSVRSRNSFPTAAGIASSSSGFAALAGACTAAVGMDPSREELSALARIGSGSAARSVFGGFVSFPAGALHARQVHPASWWPDLRIIVVVIRNERKDHSSRDAMEACRETSPFYDAWISSSTQEYDQGCDALERKDVQLLGESARRSYLRMFASMFAASPPIVYWLPESLAVIRACVELRAQGIAAWETMDAGPQVKIVTTANDEQAVRDAVRTVVPDAGILLSEVGDGLRLLSPDNQDEESAH